MAREHEIPALDLIEEAMHLLRNAPSSLGFYYLGSVPFVLGFLFFWADMSRNAYAASRCASASLALALGFIWMKCWQAVYARILASRAGAQYLEPWRVRQIFGLVLSQLIIQPWVYVIFTPLLIISLPFPFFFLFAQNVTVLGLDERDGVRGLLRRAGAQAVLWPGQGTMFCLFCVLFGFLVFMNISIALVVTPHLLKVLFGIESRFTQSPWAMLNTTFFAACFALAYLAVDPLIKAACVLRCFYGESLKTGEAIWAELDRLRRRGGVLVMVVVIGLLCPRALAADGKGTGADARAALSGAELDRSIEQTLRHPRYAWRMPRQLAVQEKEEDKSLVTLFFESLVDMFGRWFRGFFNWLGDVIDHFLDSLRIRPGPTPAPSSGGGFGILGLTRILLYTCCVLVVCAVVVLIWRMVENRRRFREALASAANVTTALPDLASEQTAADQLPTDGWLLLAQQMIEKGDLRLAMRAFYLASLAHLSGAGLVRIRRSKSNLDYVRELLRRAHAWPDLLEAFRCNVTAFDRAWYGLHEVDPDGLQVFKGNMERIRALVQ